MQVVIGKDSIKIGDETVPLPTWVSVQSIKDPLPGATIAHVGTDGTKRGFLIHWDAATPAAVAARIKHGLTWLRIALARVGELSRADFEAEMGYKMTDAAFATLMASGK